MIIIQFVRILWNKDSRGGKQAEIRNKIPITYKLPTEINKYKSSNKVIIHNITRRFYNLELKTLYDNYEICDFDKLKDNHKQVLELALIDKELEVSFKYLGHYCGSPFRYMYDKTGNRVPLNCKAFSLKNNEYGQIKYNGRFSDYDNGNWWYELHTINIIKSDNIKENIFISNKVDKIFQQLAKLK